MSGTTRTVSLNEVLTPQQREEVWKICGETPDDQERVTKLKRYYKSIEDDLLKQDILPEYLAYATEYLYHQSN